MLAAIIPSDAAALLGVWASDASAFRCDFVRNWRLRSSPASLSPDFCRHIHIKREVQVIDRDTPVSIPGRQRHRDMIENITPLRMVPQHAAVVGHASHEIRGLLKCGNSKVLTR